MKNILFILALAAILATGCKKEGEQPVTNPGQEAPATEILEQAVPTPTGERREDFTFDELFTIFSCFGDNIMTDKYASQLVKDEIRPALQDSYNGYREFNNNACNILSYTFFDDGCTDGAHMGCWRYDADGHVLVLIAEDGGCDVCSAKYIRAYDYDPATKNAHEVAIPLNPQPSAADFDDAVRLAGCTDLPFVRKVMQERVYNYAFSPEGIRIDLNAYEDWDVNGFCAFELFYRWNGSEFVRDESLPFPCIHNDGFALIKLGQPIPDLHVEGDRQGYDIEYSEGGDLWLVDLGDQRVLEIQMENGVVYSIECFDPRYSLSESFWWDGRGRLAVGSRINDYFDFTKDGAPGVRLLDDGTVFIEAEHYDTKLIFTTTKDDLDGSVPHFKPTATIKSIIISKIR